MGSQPAVPSAAPSPDQPRELALYKFNACPYCARVQRVVTELGVKVELRDVRSDAKHRQTLAADTGRTTVPCLYIDGQPLFESADIVAWLRAYAAANPAAIAS